MFSSQQTELQRRVFNRELLFGVLLLIVMTLATKVITQAPTTQEITAVFMQQVPEHDRVMYQHAVRRLMMTYPELAHQPHRWRQELQQLLSKTTSH